MKYINIKRYKFSTIFKNLNILIIKNLNTLIVKNFKRLGNNVLELFKFVDPKKYDLKRIYKYINISRFDFTKISKYLDIRRFYFTKISKYFDIRRFNSTKITKYFDPRTYNINRLGKIEFISSKFLLFHLPASIIFFGLLYLVIPTFYNYDKSNIERTVCKKQNIECSIMGKVNYSFFPTPRIKITNLIINDFVEKKNILITAEHAAIKLSIKNLLSEDRHEFKKIQLNNFEINLNIKNLKKYKNIFTKKINFIPITLTKGSILLFDEKDYVATIDRANLNLKFIQDSINTILKGKFLNDDIYVNLDIKKVDNKVLTNIILKLSQMDFLTKAHFVNSEKDKDITDGDFLIKKGKNRITAVFDYKNNEFTINKSNLNNAFLDGTLLGKITLLPYFNFNLDLNLNSINFTKLYNSFLTLDENNQKSLFKINNKINGKLNLTSDKIYSNYNLIKSLESRIKFYNGNISIEQFLLNLGKLGAADVLGTISNDKKFTNFKFESNIFVDNQKKFLSKFGIYNKQNIPSNLFISGNFDLKNIRTSFYEISNDKQFNVEDVNYIEKEFNDLMLESGYANLFHFPQFKKFIKSITGEIN